MEKREDKCFVLLRAGRVIYKEEKDKISYKNDGRKVNKLKGGYHPQNKLWNI